MVCCGGGLIPTTSTAPRLMHLEMQIQYGKPSLLPWLRMRNLNSMIWLCTLKSIVESLYRLQGTATILLKEFLAKHKNSENSRHGAEEVGSYRLRKKNSNKPQGFVDVSIHISEDMEGRSPYTGNESGPGDYSNTITLATGDGSAPALLPFTPQKRPEHQSQMNFPYANPMPSITNYSRPSAVGPSYTPASGPSYTPACGPSYTPASGPSYILASGPSYTPASGSNYIPASGPSYTPASGPSYLPASGPSYQPPRTPPPPPPPSNVGYIPTFLPRTDQMPQTYINMPSSSGGPNPGHGTRAGGPAFAMGMGAGALAAVVVIFGDDFMAGFDVPSGLQDASLTISADPPF